MKRSSSTKDSNTNINFKMAWSQKCKIAVFVGIATSAIVVLIIVLHVSRICEDKDELYYKGDQKCHKQGLQGPCNNTLVLLPEVPKSQYGGCSCASPTPTDSMNINRSLLYHKETDQCYFVFTQGPCEEGFWLNATRTGEPLCVPNRCLGYVSSDGQQGEIVPMKEDNCGILGQQGNCEDGKFVRFVKNVVHATCEEKNKKTSTGAIGVPASSCPLGSSRSIMGKCQPDFDFDFK